MKSQTVVTTLPCMENSSRNDASPPFQGYLSALHRIDLPACIRQFNVSEGVESPLIDIALC
jgi:hypothetical protein